jgi:hypothetical protein
VSQRTKTLQPLETSVVRQVRVKNGDAVTARMGPAVAGPRSSRSYASGSSSSLAAAAAAVPPVGATSTRPPPPPLLLLGGTAQGAQPATFSIALPPTSSTMSAERHTSEKAAARLGNFQSSPFWALGQRLGGGSDPLRDDEPQRPPGAPAPSITAHTGRAATKEDGVRMLQRLVMMVRREEAGRGGVRSPLPSSVVAAGLDRR